MARHWQTFFFIDRPKADKTKGEFHKRKSNYVIYISFFGTKKWLFKFSKSESKTYCITRYAWLQFIKVLHRDTFSPNLNCICEMFKEKLVLENNLSL